VIKLEGANIFFGSLHVLKDINLTVGTPLLYKPGSILYGEYSRQLPNTIVEKELMVWIGSEQ